MRIEFTVDRNHPAFEGHFPGAPVLPAAVLLALIAEAIEGATASRVIAVHSARFSRAVNPGDCVNLDAESPGDGEWRFSCQINNEAVARGRLRVEAGDD